MNVLQQKFSVAAPRATSGQQSMINLADGMTKVGGGWETSLISELSQ